MTPDRDANLISWWLAARKRLVKDARKFFDSLVALTAWRLWNERNARIFRAQSTQAAALADSISDGLREWMRAGLVSNLENE
ncbi:tRNA guanosine-2' [Panicum miliaceum]|uniref:tRNA guanosine-2 n=1 Tax=Panicum miliaceum TaxID=4540 RepID=A0A3L6SXW2_PANMI|nr:tRNA guanosine-2' [Panicum miliaceum]